MKTYALVPDGIWMTIQGEGRRAGTPTTFLRFSRCNLACSFCDTDFTYHGDDWTAEKIVARILELMPKDPCVVLTGGEPLLQHDEELAAALREADIYIAVETSGSVRPRGYADYIAISPKVPESVVARNFVFADELRYVIRAGAPLPTPTIECDDLYLSPEFDGEMMNQANVDWAVKLVKENPWRWRLSIQTHKLAGFR